MALKNDEVDKVIDGRVYKRFDKSFIGILKYIINTNEMNNKIDNSSLSHSSLINIAKDYHNLACTDGSECIIYQKRSSVKPFRIAPVIGVNMSTIRYMNIFEEKYKFDASTAFSVGINMNFSLAGIDEKLFFQLQTLYTKHSFSSKYESSKTNEITGTSSYTIQTNSDINIRINNVLQIELAFKYEYPKGKIRPVLSIGPASTFLSGATVENNTLITFLYYNEGKLIHTNEVPSYDKSDFNVKFMCGFDIIPGVHFYLNNNQIIFIQLQYMQCFGRAAPNTPPHIIRSYGLSSGIYF